MLCTTFGFLGRSYVVDPLTLISLTSPLVVAIRHSERGFLGDFLRAHPFQSSSQELLRTIYGNLGELHYEAGNFDSAMRYFEVLLEQYPSGSSAHHRTLNCLGDCHAARGSYSEARRYSIKSWTQRRLRPNSGCPRMRG
jgi:tetratricopeptide (TPR) repeat protein